MIPGTVFLALGAVALTLPGCGGGGGGTAAANAATVSGSSAAAGSLFPIPYQHTDASLSGLQLMESDPGVSPFIQWLSLHLNSTARLKSVEFRIQPKAGSASQAVDVSYANSALVARGYMSSEGATLKMPVFGLYDGYTNQVTLKFSFQDESTQTLTTSITTAEYSDPTGIYQHPTILTQRSPTSSLGFNFFFMKSALGSSVVVDTDGEVRWAVPGIGNSQSTGLQDDEFVTGDPSTGTVHRLRLDGTVSQSALATTATIWFHHNIDRGKTALLADINTEGAGVENIESTVMEMTDQGSILNQWDLAAILSAYMSSMGDDPAAFIRPGIDWFHNNAAAYDPSDDSVIISSRENFVIKLDYLTGHIIWILGDPTKYWYTFPSLRAKALTLAAGGLYPIGQHAISITPKGYLLLFNDGLGSENQPAGAPAGETRTYSAVSAYSIDVNTMTAQNVWNFTNGETIFSSVCSSAYRAPGESLLIDYATADNVTIARLVGLDSNHNVAFDFEYPTQGCNTSWNAVPIPLENFTIN